MLSRVTIWDTIQVMALLVLAPALVVLVLLLLVRVLRPVAERSVLVRMICRLLWIAMVTIVVFVALWIALGVSVEVFGERAVVRWLPYSAPVLCGLGLYGWGRLVWRFKREKKIGPCCNRCGYDVKGLVRVPRPPCPECGRVLPANERRLYRAPTRKWATRLGVPLIVAGITVAPAVGVYRHGWQSVVPDWVLLRMLVGNVKADVASQELGQRGVYLRSVDPRWTLDLMVSFAEEYDAATSGGATPPWTIFNRFYPLYQAPSDEKIVALAREWCASPSVGRRLTASGMMTVQGFCPAPERLNALRPLLNDPDPTVRVHTIRALGYDAAMPIDELLAVARDYANWRGLGFSVEIDNALANYTDPRAREMRLELAADRADPWSDIICWRILHDVFDFNSRTVKPGGLTELARAKAVVPTARSAWLSGSFELVYRTLAGAAAAKPGTDGEDAQTASWCRAALVSYATTPPGPIPGAPLSFKPAILVVLDDMIAGEQDASVRARLKALREELSPSGNDGAASDDGFGLRPAAPPK